MTHDGPSCANSHLSTCVAVAPHGRAGRILRSLSVSAITTGLSVSILGAMTQLTSVPPAAANVIATVAGIGPSFALNRRWAWRRSGRSHLRREVIPFWSYALAALVLSTIAVSWAAQWAASVGASSTVRTVIVLAANLLTFGALWCGQFLLLERVLSERTEVQSGRGVRVTASTPAAHAAARTARPKPTVQAPNDSTEPRQMSSRR